MYKTPLRFLLQPSVDSMGQDEHAEGLRCRSCQGLGYAQPSKVSTAQLSDTDKVLYDLYERTKDSRVSFGCQKVVYKDKVKYEMNDTQYTQLRRSKGRSRMSL